MHEVGDHKLVDQNTTTYRLVITNWLEDKLSSDKLEWLIKICESVSWSTGVQTTDSFSDTELHIVQDADRIEALGAIGIARVFAVGESLGQLLYSPESQPSSFKHVEEKILKLYQSLNFDVSRRIAIKRHKFTTEFARRFLAEWNLEDLAN